MLIFLVIFFIKIMQSLTIRVFSALTPDFSPPTSDRTAAEFHNAACPALAKLKAAPFSVGELGKEADVTASIAGFTPISYNKRNTNLKYNFWEDTTKKKNTCFNVQALELL